MSNPLKCQKSFGATFCDKPTTSALQNKNDESSSSVHLSNLKMLLILVRKQLHCYIQNQLRVYTLPLLLIIFCLKNLRLQ